VAAGRGYPLAHPLDLSEPVWGVALRGNIIVTAVDGDIAIHSQPLHDPYEIASCSAASADRYDHRIMAGYPVQHGRPPVIFGGKGQEIFAAIWPGRRARGREAVGAIRLRAPAPGERRKELDTGQGQMQMFAVRLWL
jgi:hypothetical protein